MQDPQLSVSPQDDPASVLGQIRASLAGMSPAERRAGETILNYVQAAISWSLADCARFAGVSEPSVIRFCRRIGYEGYSDFRVKLGRAVTAQEKNRKLVHAPSGDPVTDTLTEIAQSTIRAIGDLKLDFDPVAMQRAVEAISGARRVDVYGHGLSSFLAGEAQIRLVRIGISSSAYSDPALEMFSALSLEKTDVVLALSFSGASAYPLDNLEIARSRGARIVAICPTGSAVAEAADIHVPINAYRQQDPKNFLSADRLTMWVMIDAVIQLVWEQRGAHREAYD